MTTRMIESHWILDYGPVHGWQTGHGYLHFLLLGPWQTLLINPMALPTEPGCCPRIAPKCSLWTTKSAREKPHSRCLGRERAWVWKTDLGSDPNPEMYLLRNWASYLASLSLTSSIWNGNNNICSHTHRGWMYVRPWHWVWHLLCTP